MLKNKNQNRFKVDVQLLALLIIWLATVPVVRYGQTHRVEVNREILPSRHDLGGLTVTADIGWPIVFAQEGVQTCSYLALCGEQSWEYTAVDQAERAANIFLLASPALIATTVYFISQNQDYINVKKRVNQTEHYKKIR